MHYAQSLDGRIATHSKDSQWIGGPASLRLAHQLRAEHGAVMVGVGTVMADNPRLTVRLVPGASPRRVVVDSTLRLPLDAHVLTDGLAPTLVATTERAPLSRRRAVSDLGAEVLVVEANERGNVDLHCLLGRLHAAGIESLLIEGGGGIITSALRQRLVDRLVVVIAPKLIGAGTEAVGDLGVGRLRDALGFASACFRLLDEDVVFEGHFDRAP